MAKRLKVEKWQYPIPFRRIGSGIAIDVVQVYRTSNEFGRAMGCLECPCCKADVEFYIWSMAGGGKRCPNCNALLATRMAIIKNEELPKGLKLDGNLILG